MERNYLTAQEANHLVQSILEGIEFIENGGELRSYWIEEMRDWVDLLIDRLTEGGDA